MGDVSQNVISKIPDGVLAPFSGWPFLSCCLAVAIVVLTLKRVVNQGWPTTFAKGKAHAAFTASYLVLGILAAIPKSYLYGSMFYQRVIVGVIAGGVSLAVYHALLKRVAGMLGVKETEISDPDDDQGLHAISAQVKPDERKP